MQRGVDAARFELQRLESGGIHELTLEQSDALIFRASEEDRNVAANIDGLATSAFYEMMG